MTSKIRSGRLNLVADRAAGFRQRHTGEASQDKFQIPHISTGDMFRENITNRPSLA